jgi:site-specific recombinase XerC
LFAKGTKATSTYAGNVREAQRLVRAFDGYLSKLTTAMIEKYKVQRSQHVKPATVNRELALLKHMLTKAVEWGYLKNSPGKSVRLLKEPPGRLRYLEAEQIEHLLDNCDDPQVPYLRPIVKMALHTGMRLGEILGLRWDDIDLKRRLITITKTKNNERKTIPINDALYEELNRLPRAVFKSRDGIAAIGEPAMSVRCGHRRQGLLDRQLQRRTGARLGGTQEGLDLRPGVLEWGHIRRVWRQVEQSRPAPRNDLTDGGHCMSPHVIQHADVARAQCWAQDLRRIRVKDLSIRGPCDRHDGREAVQGEGCHHGQGGAIVLRHGPDDALSPGRAPEPPRHGQVDARLVDTLEPLEIERLNQRVVIRPRVLDPLGVTLRRMESLVFRGKPKRRTTRHIVGTLTRMPVVSAARVHNSATVASDGSCTS